MKFTLKQVDSNGNVIDISEVDVDVTEKQVKEYDELFCDCNYLEENPKANSLYVENYKGVSHGWICPKCKHFVQIG